MEDFLELEPTIADVHSSHVHLRMEYERLDQEQGWATFLERAQRLGMAERPAKQLIGSGSHGPEDSFTKHGLDAQHPTDRDILFQVPVRPGWEQTYTFRIMEGFVSRSGSVPAIRAVVGRTTFPGFIFIEAPDIKAAFDVCAPFKFVKRSDIVPLGFAESKAVLQEQQTYTPCTPSWVRVKSGLYRGDTGFVYDVTQNLEATILLIPRISAESSKKRKKQSRPPQALFDANIVSLYHKVEQRNQTYVLDGKSYIDGFLIKNTQNFYHHYDTLPRREELQLFELFPRVPRHFIQTTYDAINASEVRPGHRVLVTRGELQGCVGIVQTLIPDSVRTLSIFIPSVDRFAEVDSRDCRNDLRAGDEVRVTDGSNAGFVGWVVASQAGFVVICNPKLKKEVKEHTRNVEFWSGHILAEPEGIELGVKVQVVKGPKAGFVGEVIEVNDEGGVTVARHVVEGPMINVSIKDLQVLTADHPLPIDMGFLRPDPNRKYIGGRVVMRTKGHRHYRGIIRDTLNDDYALVELEATLRRVRVKLIDLALDVGGRLYTFEIAQSKDLLAQEEEDFLHQEEEDFLRQEQRIIRPLESTPMVSLSQRVAEDSVWNPSARTPIPPSSQPLVPSTPLPPSMSQPVIRPPTPPRHPRWFDAPNLPLERLKTRILGTKPVLRDPGWKNGRYEGRGGSIRGVDHWGAKILIHISDIPHVPSQYIFPERPTLQGEFVVVLSGPLQGTEFTVSRVDGSTCQVKPRKKTSGKVKPIPIETDLLCVVCR